jgi:hypothetical protein
MRGQELSAPQIEIFNNNIALISDVLRQLFKNNNRDLDIEIENGDVLINVVKYEMKNVMNRVIDEMATQQALTDFVDGAQNSGNNTYVFTGFRPSELKPLGLLRQEIIEFETEKDKEN